MFSSKTYNETELRNKEADLNFLISGENQLPLQANLQLLKNLSKTIMMRDNWQSAKCTCKIFLKTNECEQIVSLAQTAPLGQKRKRGRAAKAKKALKAMTIHILKFYI